MLRWNRSWPRNDGDALLIRPSSLEYAGQQEVHLCSIKKTWTRSIPLTESVAFDTLLHDESLSEDVREIMRTKYE